jgi:hypothetical protein
MRGLILAEARALNPIRGLPGYSAGGINGPEYILVDAMTSALLKVVLHNLHRLHHHRR